MTSDYFLDWSKVLSIQNNILSDMNLDVPLKEVLCKLTDALDELDSGHAVTILLSCEEGLKPTAGSRIPKEWVKLIDPLPLGDFHGSCGTAGYFKKQIIVENILTDPLWANYREYQPLHGFMACWSQPVIGKNGELLGTFAVYFKEPRKPKQHELDIIMSLSLSVRVLIERKQYEESLQKEIQKKTIKLQDLNKNLERRIKEEVEKNQFQQHQMFQQSRLAQIGEMISMIAHQWRQPISAISMGANNILTDIELNCIDEKVLKDEAQDIVSLTMELSKTIDDFRTFYKPNKDSVVTKLGKVITKSLNIIKLSLHNDNIEIIEKYNSEEKIKIYDRELMQVILNILKNSQDNLKDKKVKNPYIKITTKNKTISISDNGGGVPENIINKIFNPYFSTKDEKNGTGLGLYISKMIVEEHHNGKLSAKNTKDGLCVKIKLGII